MRILVWKCRRWLGRKVYSEPWWQEHSDLHRLRDLAEGDTCPASRATLPVVAPPASHPSPLPLAPLGFDPPLPAASRG